MSLQAPSPKAPATTTRPFAIRADRPRTDQPDTTRTDCPRTIRADRPNTARTGQPNTIRADQLCTIRAPKVPAGIEAPDAVRTHPRAGRSTTEGANWKRKA